MTVTATSNNYSTSTVGSTGSGSLQLFFAQLQLEQASLAKEDATAYLDKIQESQAEQTLCAEMISAATALMDAADTGSTTTTMTQTMIDFFKDRGITYDTSGNDYNHSKDEWEYNIENLSAYRDELGTTTQTDMVYVEDFLGQYNSYLTGADSSIESGNQTLQSILS